MFRPYKPRVFADGGNNVLPVSKSVPPSSSASSSSAPKRRSFWSFDGNSGFVATKSHEEAEREAKGRPPRSSQSQCSKGSNRFWNFDIEKGFRAAEKYEKERITSNVSTPSKYQPHVAKSYTNSGANTPSGWSTPTETGTAPTAMTTPSRSIITTKSVKTSNVTANQHVYAQPYQTNNQKINEQRMLKRRLEHQVQHRLQPRQTSSANSGSPNMQSVRKSPTSKTENPQRHSVRKVPASQSTPQSPQRRVSNQPRLSQSTPVNNATPQSPQRRVSHQLSPQRRVSNNSRPVQPGLTRKQQLRNQAIANTDSCPPTSRHHSEVQETECYPPPPVTSIHITRTSVSPITTPVLTKPKKKVSEKKMRELQSMTVPGLSKGGNRKGEPTGKGKKKIIRTMVLKNPNARREKHERILAEKEAEIRRMEARIEELKLLREIRILEEELKGHGVNPMPNTQIPSINPISGLPSPTRMKKQAVTIPQQHHHDHFPSRPSAQHYQKPLTSVDLPHYQAPRGRTNQSISHMPNILPLETKTKSTPSWMNHTASNSPAPPPVVSSRSPPSPPLTSRQKSDVEDPVFVSSGFQQMQQKLLQSMQNTSRNPHFSTQPAKKLEIRKPTPLPPQKKMLSPHEELMMRIKGRS